MQNKTNTKMDNDSSWQSALKSGKEQLGNLEVNLHFLRQSNCLKPDISVLELGCGIGTIVHWLQKQGFRAVGSDISKIAIEYGRRKFPEITLAIESADQLSRKDKEFDIVLSFDVFEHLYETDKHLKEVSRVLKPNGLYLFQTPNKYAYALYDTIRLRSLEWKRYHPSLHTPRKLKKRLQQQGFSVQFIKMNPVTPFFLAKLKKVPFLGQLAKIIPFRHLPLCLQTNLYVIARKQ